MNRLQSGVACYWRFKKQGGAYRYGWPVQAERGMWQMGRYNGDTNSGIYVDEDDIEFK